MASVLKIALSLSEVRARLRLSLCDFLLGQRWTGRRSASTPLGSWLLTRNRCARCGVSKRKERVLVFAVGASAFAEVVTETKSLGNDVGFVFVDRFQSCDRGFAYGSASLALRGARSAGRRHTTCRQLDQQRYCQPAHPPPTRAPDSHRAWGN